MNRYILTFSLLLLLASCIGDRLCRDKVVFLEGFEKFTLDVRDNYHKLEGKDWDHIDKEFQHYVDECYPKFKEELNLGEKLTFWKSTLMYGFYREKEAGKEHDFMTEIQLDLSEEFEELSIETKEELERFIKVELGDDIEKAIDDVIEGIESIGEELKNWLDNQ